MPLSFEIGKDESVNFIIGKLTLLNWRANIDFDEDLLVSKQLNTKFALKYRITRSRMPVNVKFNGKYFFRTPKPTHEGQAFILTLDRDNIGINNNPQM